MNTNSKHRGSSFDDFLKEEGILEEVTNRAQENIFYQELLKRWGDARIEKDKQLFYVSLTVVVLLIILENVKGLSSLYVVTFICFSLNLVLINYIMLINSQYIEQILQENKIENDLLSFLDRACFFFFVVGMASLSLAAISNFLR